MDKNYTYIFKISETTEFLSMNLNITVEQSKCHSFSLFTFITKSFTKNLLN